MRILHHFLGVWRTLLGLSLAFCLLVGCASLLGIEEANCDPSFDPNCDPTFVDDDDDDDDDDDGDAGEELTEEERLCNEYCSTLELACTEANGAKQYETETACFEICVNGLDEGEPGDSNVDTIHCRLDQAENAAVFGEEAEDCANAGLSGNGACSDVCEVYCTLVESLCTGIDTVQGVAIVEDYDDCLAACADVPRTPEPFNFTIDSGDSLECRFWHLQAAFGNARTHCQHAVGLSICAP